MKEVKALGGGGGGGRTKTAPSAEEGLNVCLHAWRGVRGLVWHARGAWLIVGLVAGLLCMWGMMGSGAAGNIPSAIKSHKYNARLLGPEKVGKGVP